MGLPRRLQLCCFVLVCLSADWAAAPVYTLLILRIGSVVILPAYFSLNLISLFILVSNFQSFLFLCSLSADRTGSLLLLHFNFDCLCLCVHCPQTGQVHSHGVFCILFLFTLFCYPRPPSFWVRSPLCFFCLLIGAPKFILVFSGFLSADWTGSQSLFTCIFWVPVSRLDRFTVTVYSAHRSPLLLSPLFPYLRWNLSYPSHSRIFCRTLDF